MKFSLKNEAQRKIFIYSASLIIAIIAYLLLSRIDEITHFVGRVFEVLMPFLLGFGLAFILNGPETWIENRLARFPIGKKGRRLLSVAIIFLLTVIFVIFSFWVVIPSLMDSIKIFLENFSSYAIKIEDWILSMAKLLNMETKDIQTFFSNLNLPHLMNTFMGDSMSTVLNYSINAITLISNLIIGAAAAFYMLVYKETLLHTCKMISYSLLPKSRANFMVLYTIDAKNVFQQYIVGNILDSLLVGLICWLGLLILRIPYAPMIGFLIGVTNVIPVFGPFLGAIPVILLLLVIKPAYALIFAVFILVLQQVDGNVMKPVILGDKLGINGFWILFAVTVGGSLFGIAGMFLGVPIFALIYEGVQDFVDIRLASKKMTIPDESGVITR